MDIKQIKNIVEAVLLAIDKPVNLNQFITIFAKNKVQLDKKSLHVAVEEIAQDYQDRGLEIKEVASGFRIQIKADYADWVNCFVNERSEKYSIALLETLAIIAYRQPITRAEIEDIRGVGINVSIIKTLRERGWIRIAGKRDIPGRPELLVTSKEFLDYFNLKKLTDLPPIGEIKDFDTINSDLFSQSDAEVQANEILDPFAVIGSEHEAQN